MLLFICVKNRGVGTLLIKFRGVHFQWAGASMICEQVEVDISTQPLSLQVEVDISTQPLSLSWSSSFLVHICNKKGKSIYMYL